MSDPTRMTAIPPRSASGSSSAPSRDVLTKAAEVGRRDIQSALNFLAQFGGPPAQAAGNILLANHFLQSEERWLHHLNLYLHPYGISPIELKGPKRDRFFRLHSTPPNYVEDGPLVSIIMPAFNAEETVETALRSLLAQSWRNIEIIVIDDKSSDRTNQIVKTLAKQDGRIRVFRNPANIGPYGSRNLAVTQSHGMFITTHDADDWAHPQRIEMQVSAIRDHQLAGVVMRAIRMTKKGEFSQLGNDGTPESHDGVLKTSHVSAMFLKEDFDKRLGSWDTVRFAADSELLSRSKIAFGERFAEFAKPTLIYFDNPTSLTNNPRSGFINGALSPVRLKYRQHWSAWHDALDTSKDTYMPFPQQNRPFEAPDAMKVPAENVEQCRAKFDGSA
ncbi:hypothetical protein IZ6_28680 [Terrihabitans soli]|uniref:Glycosyltransferase 2-like domain-containing protein n=1 Tax=Terrihabitans soli TaxID=708113 RepID=A0A6S6QLB5_9HYPH|nr:glycosyltransferase family 2 protein [Terrihabitans soli]BCJ92133.1 hypothetical protein IZ6_28680 [Terrihabitans soli]